MTTEARTTTPQGRPYGVAALGVAVLAGSGAGVLVAALGAAIGGGAGATGALVGAGVTLLVLATGFAVVDLVAGLMPAASIVVALLTYTLQMVVLAALLVVLRESDGVGATLTPEWFAAGVIAVAASWTVCLVVHATRARVPLYDLPAAGVAEPTSAGAPGSEA